uniref:DUF4283 domain-containing protein n=1 Tax=Cannabis sativa TaxID=3483 RepID=A0A803PV58_CANSA
MGIFLSSITNNPISIQCRISEVLQLDEIDGPVIKLNKESLEDCRRRLEVEKLSADNVFRFFFGSKEDRQRVFGGRPWMFEKQLICFVKLMELGEVSKMTFDHASFWILIKNVPLACMSELFARDTTRNVTFTSTVRYCAGKSNFYQRISQTALAKRSKFYQHTFTVAKI